MEKRYRIGDISKLLNIPISNLRFYEDKGIVKPYKDKTNGYRYYTAWDLNDIIDTLRFREMDFSLEDIEAILKKEDLDSITLHYMEQEQKLLKKIQKYSHMLEVLSNERIRIQHVKEHIGLFSVCKSPGFIFHRFRKKNTLQNKNGIESVDEIYDKSKEWLEAFPEACPSFYVPMHSLLQNAPQDIEYWYGYSMSYACAVQNHIKMVSPNEYLPSTTCVYTVFTAHEEGTFMESFYENVYKEIINQGKNIVGSPYGRLVVKSHEEQNYQRYFEAWVPILE